MNCNLAGVDAYLDAMNWPYKTQFFAAPRLFWRVGENLAGYSRNYRNLTNLIVRNAGHEVHPISYNSY
jgi:hypothetical protein